MKGILLIIAAILLGLWWWRKNYVPSPLENHYANLEAKQQVGNFAQLAQWTTQPVAAMVGEGWGTTARINPTNIGYNRPGITRLNVRFAQPSGGGSGQLMNWIHPIMAPVQPTSTVIASAVTTTS